MEWQTACVLKTAAISAVSWANSSNRPQELVAIASQSTVWVMGLTAHADSPKVKPFILTPNVHSKFPFRRWK